MQINIAHYKMNISEHSYSNVLCIEQCGGKKGKQGGGEGGGGRGEGDGEVKGRATTTTNKQTTGRKTRTNIHKPPYLSMSFNIM